MKSEVAEWIDSWPLWERQAARRILSRELTQPSWRNENMTKGEKHFWYIVDAADARTSLHPNQWNLLDQESRDRWEALAVKVDSREQREREKKASVRASDGATSDGAESEQQGDGTGK